MVRRINSISDSPADSTEDTTSPMKSISIVEPQTNSTGNEFEMITSGFVCGSPSIMKLVNNVESDLEYLMGTKDNNKKAIPPSTTPTPAPAAPAPSQQEVGINNTKKDGTSTTTTKQQQSVMRSSPKYSGANTDTTNSQQVAQNNIPAIMDRCNVDADKRQMLEAALLDVVTPRQLAKQLCRLVDNDKYIRSDAMVSLDKLFEWAQTECPHFMKCFDRYAGIVYVTDFFNEQLETSSGDILIEAIKKISIVIKSVVYSGAKGQNKDVAKKIATAFVEAGGIYTLKRASDKYSGGEGMAELWAIQSLWGVLRNITCKPDVMRNVVNKNQAIDLLDTGLNVVVQLKSVKGREAECTLEDAYIVMSNVVSNGYLDVKHFEEKDIINICLEPFRMIDGTYSGRSEIVTNKAINFFNWCHNKSLLEKSHNSVYSMLLPFFAMSMKQFPRNDKIVQNVFNFLEYTCTVIDDKSEIERAGFLEALSTMLVTNGVSDEKKKKVRKLIMAIAA